MASSLSSSPPGRRDRQKLDRERRIIQAAQRLFSRRGYSATSMEDVAARAGLAVGTIYNYFPSKPELLLAIVRRETASILERGRRFIEAPAGDPVDGVAGMVLLYFDDFMREDRDLWRELFAAAMVAPATVGRRVFEADASVVAQLAEYLDRLKANSLIRADVETAVAATAIYAVCFTWLIAYLSNDQVNPAFARMQIRRGIDVVIRGLLPEPVAPVKEET